MNSNSGYPNVLTTVPTQQSVNIVPNRIVSNDHSSHNFQQALDDIRSEQKEKSEAAKKITSKHFINSRNKSPIENNHISENSSANKNININNNNAKIKNTKDEDNVTNNHAGIYDNKLPLAEQKSSVIDTQKETLDSDAEEDTRDTSIEQMESAAITDTSMPSINSITSPLQITATTAVNEEGDDVLTGLENTENSKNSLFNTFEVKQLVLGNKISPTDMSIEQSNELLNSGVEGVLAAGKLATTYANAALLTHPPLVTAYQNNSTVLAPTHEAGNLAGNEMADSTNVFEKMLQAIAVDAGANNNSDEPALGSGAHHSLSELTTSTTTSSTTSPLDFFNRASDSLSLAGRSFVVQAAIPVTVGQPQWSQAVGEKVLWLAAQNVTSAEIRLDPPDLGPMQIKISINQDQASVNFTSHHAGVREVLDQSLNRLRDMFSEQGLNLVNVDVSDKSFHHQQGEGKGGRPSSDTTASAEDETSTSVSAIVHQRLVDHYV